MTVPDCGIQGDQIGRFFAYWADFLKITKVVQNFRATFFTVKVVHYKVSQKMGLATFWAVYSQTRLVTLHAQRPIHSMLHPSSLVFVGADSIYVGPSHRGKKWLTCI
jgi:hypothetical protein